jgi:hypothetical protein
MDKSSLKEKKMRFFGQHQPDILFQMLLESIVGKETLFS